jgi:hypothetical protein
VSNDVLVEAFDLKRRDVSDANAFAYFVGQIAVFESVEKLDKVTVRFHKNAAHTTYTQMTLTAQDVNGFCGRCGAKRGVKHYSFCDVAKVRTVPADTATSATAVEFDAADVLKKRGIDVTKNTSQSSKAQSSKSQPRTPRSPKSSVAVESVADAATK